VRAFRIYRLITKAEFKYVFDKAHKINHKYLLVLYRPNQKQHARIGITIGKRIVNHAVDRNRIKRVIKESFRINREKVSGFDIVVLIRRQCDLLSKEELRKGVDYLWEKLVRQHLNQSSS